MRSRTGYLSPFLLAVLAWLSAASTHLSAALENGEVVVNAEPPATGQTSTAAQSIALIVVDAPIGSAALLGPMTAIDHRASGAINSAAFQSFSLATSLVDFVDNLVVNAEGIATGTQLIVEVGWTVNGAVSISSPPQITTRSRVLLEAAGIDLDPDPEAPPPPKQSWTRDASNFVPEVSDPEGLVTFEFLVRAGTPQPGNIRLRTVAGIQCGGPGSNIFSSYLASASADLTVDFVGATRVKTAEDIELYRWTTAAASALDYGERDDDPPATPVLTVGPSAGGPGFVNLSWDTMIGEYYLVQATTDNSGWGPVTEVRGTANPVSIDLFQEDTVLAYRLIPQFGIGNPDSSPRRPVLRITKEAAAMRVAWQTNHWEQYSLNEISANGIATPLNPLSGDGGVHWFDFTPAAPARIFQVSATLK